MDTMMKLPLGTKYLVDADAKMLCTDMYFKLVYPNRIVRRIVTRYTAICRSVRSDNATKYLIDTFYADAAMRPAWIAAVRSVGLTKLAAALAQLPAAAKPGRRA